MFATDCMNCPIPVHSNSSQCDHDVRLEVVVCVLAGLVAALALTVIVVVIHWFRHGFWKRTKQRAPNCNCKNKSSTTVVQESKVIPSSAAEDVKEKMDTGTAKHFLTIVKSCLLSTFEAA